MVNSVGISILFKYKFRDKILSPKYFNDYFVELEKNWICCNLAYITLTFVLPINSINKNMRVIHLSDTHNQHHKMTHLPEADIIVHSGDISFARSEDEAVDFIQWFISLPNKYKIFIAGNHDDCLYGANIDGLPENCFYLCNSSVTIEGLKFYGLPMFMEDMMSGKYDEIIQSIPDDTDILITYQSPYGILDFSENTHYGDHVLLQTVMEIHPRYHLFGHIHNACEIEKGKDTIFSNASLLDGEYRLMNRPFVFEL